MILFISQRNHEGKITCKKFSNALHIEDTVHITFLFLPFCLYQESIYTMACYEVIFIEEYENQVHLSLSKCSPNSVLADQSDLPMIFNTLSFLLHFHHCSCPSNLLGSILATRAIPVVGWESMEEKRNRDGNIWSIGVNFIRNRSNSQLNIKMKYKLDEKYL